MIPSEPKSKTTCLSPPSNHGLATSSLRTRLSATANYHPSKTSRTLLVRIRPAVLHPRYFPTRRPSVKPAAHRCHLPTRRNAFGDLGSFFCLAYTAEFPVINIFF
ncbi:hypothetical protein RvY_08934-2 [Ramazzottius varieornatus]|uniref:Uncharacterized protein n=1 Tax=Ramazzottius varieornatus TaxID=947166 RepID=A0A1D1V9T0_RAMVA|nr:hypothetical protein RvY_08934-2 [Ramazzottius varieornatus]